MNIIPIVNSYTTANIIYIAIYYVCNYELALSYEYLFKKI